MRNKANSRVVLLGYYAIDLTLKQLKPHIQITIENKPRNLLVDTGASHELLLLMDRPPLARLINGHKAWEGFSEW
ncbi:MAG: hypothetical protein OER04_19895 [Cyclobacteriaceae bacterium]|nr:hypothetical protein [Cyclobacteriaceae bacterium]